MEKKIRVLLVDDEEQFVINMAKILKVRGFEVSTAFDGYEAVDAIEHEGRFDVVLLDVKMPGLDGIAVLREIKKREPDTEVIMLTGHATLTSGTQAMREGAYDYLMKPCDIEDLTEKLREAYHVESIKRHPVLWVRQTVNEITLGFFKKLHHDDPVINAIKIFDPETRKTVVEEVYIQDHEDRLMGIVTKRDLLNEAQDANPELSLDWTQVMENPELLPPLTLGQVMRADRPVTTSPEESLTETAQRMISNNVRCMPVVEDGKVLGIVRMQDILQYVEHEIE